MLGAEGEGGGITGSVGKGGERRWGGGEEKTRLPQHDLQIALSPWRLLSAPLFDPKWRRRRRGGGELGGDGERGRAGRRGGTLTKISPRLH